MLVGLVLGGCGSGGGGVTDNVSAATKGLTYSLKIAPVGGKRCATASYRTALPDGRPILQSSYSCGPATLAGQPLLIQAKLSRQAMLVDVPPGGCPAVRAGRTLATARSLASSCTSPHPLYRVTILPVSRRLVLIGVAGAPVINFPRHPCRMAICITTLA